MVRWMGWASLLAGLAVVGCPSEEHGGKPTATTSAPARPSATTSAAPPAASPDAGAPTSPPASISSTNIVVPKTLTPGSRGAFVLFLHGLGASGSALVRALGVAELAEKRHFVWAAPDGPKNHTGQRFWNASRACCDFDGSALDHVAELAALLSTARNNPSVDPKRVYVVGYSNGGFMAHRLACQEAGIAGIVSIAGAGPADADPPCKPSAPVAVLQIHGDADKIVRYAGGQTLSRSELAHHPSALETVSAWAARDGCGAAPTLAGTLDLEPKLPGDETLVQRFAGCRKPVELWRVKEGSHFVAQSMAALDLALSFLEKASSR